MRQFAFFALVVVLSLTTVSGEIHAASCWTDPASITAIGDTSPGSLTIDPSGNWELVYDAWDDQNNMVRIKYFNSTSPSPVTVVEYPVCTSWPCPQGQVEDLEGLTSARDATGKLHVAYGIEWGADDPDETFYMYKGASGWSTPASIAAVDDTPGSLTIDPSGYWELVYDAWDDENDIVRIKYFNSGSGSPPVTVVEYQVCWVGPCPPGSIEDLEGITSARDATGKLHVAYGIESPVDYTDATFYMYKDAGGWHTPPTPVTAIGDASPGSLTIDPSGYWELVYDSWDDQNNTVRIKYYNSSSPGPVTVIEYQECWDGPSCPPGTIADLEGITSARDATGKLHVAYGFESAIDWVDATYYMHTDDTSVGADFTANVFSGKLPLTVNFTDQSCGTITSWQWNFGDGATSNEQNPSHTYSKPGTFTVSLTVNGSDTETKPDYITVDVTGMPGIPLLLLDD